MSWWAPSWLSLPSVDFSLPSGIQGRFISFILKRTLGHFLKPGQLDVQQIDSQIGSGYVQVRDLELDYDAINALLAGLPVQLHDGSISSVTARIPWPNPLTASIGLSVQSPHLTFYLDPAASTKAAPQPPDLADSVFSVAESFIHDELTPGEEATLRESIHPDQPFPPDVRANVPGGLDPFINLDEVVPPDVDPAGVSVFATLIERLLSRFEFDAADIAITLVHPGNASFTLRIANVKYGKADDAPAAEGETRVMTIGGLEVSYQDLTPLRRRDSIPFNNPPAKSPNTHDSYSTSHPSPPSPSPPASPEAQSDSDMDEDTNLMMSQSLASLPMASSSARPVSPTSTVASSMFQSAISTVPEESNAIADSGHLSPQPEKRLEYDQYSSHISSPLSAALASVAALQEETLFSFALEPITIQLTTSLGSRTTSSVEPTSKGSGQVSISANFGVLACALRARHLRSALVLMNSLPSSPPPRHSQPSRAKKAESSHPVPSSMTSLLDQVEASLHIRGIIFLLLPSESSQTPPTPSGAGTGITVDPSSLATFFARPLVPPKLPHSFLRLFVDGVHGSSSFVTSRNPPSGVGKGQSSRNKHSSPTTTAFVVTGSLSVHDISLCVFQLNSSTASSPDSVEHIVTPILITDPNLPSQYVAQHVAPPRLATHSGQQSIPPQPPQLPSFDLLDWTLPSNHITQPKLSRWRVRAPHNHPSQTATASPHSPHVALPPLVPENDAPRNAVTISFKSSRSTATRKQTPEERHDPVIEVDFAPLHIFADLALLDCSASGKLSSEALRFLDEVSDLPVAHVDPSPVQSSTERDDSDSDLTSIEDDGDGGLTPPASPRMQRAMRLQEAAKEREAEKRKRLDRYWIEDLGLSMDYRATEPKPKHQESSRRRRLKRKEPPQKPTESRTSQITVRLPMIRMEVRCPPPVDSPPRSGAFVVDVHGFMLCNGDLATRARPSTRFASADDTPSSPISQVPATRSTKLLSAECQRVLFAASLAGESKAQCFLSLGPILDDTTASSGEGDNWSPLTQTPTLPPRPICLSISRPPTSAAESPNLKTSGALVVAFELPSLYVSLSKPVLDDLQFWADDIAKLSGRAFGVTTDDGDTETGSSGDPSLIGSRFFVKTSRKSSKDSSTILGSGHAAQRSDRASGETVIKASISEVFVRLLLPREESESSPSIEPFDLLSSDIDALVELKPEGKDETVITLSVMDLAVIDRASSFFVPYLLAATPRSMSSLSRPLIKLRFNSLTVPESTAKESRIRVTLSDFTYNFTSDLLWIKDIERFVKSPPGAFEEVVPSERTRISIKVADGSVRLFAPTHPGALVVHIEDAEFNTDIVGDSPELQLSLQVSALQALLTDDAQAASEQSAASAQKLVGGKGSTYWKRAGHALLAELSDLDLVIKKLNGPPPSSEVIVDGVTLRIHLCADTGSALGAFAGDLGSAFSPAVDESERPPPPSRAPTTVSSRPDTQTALLSSLDEQAFYRLPEVGAAPDMIMDDLPSNPEYLDSSFGAAAGLREFDDEDLEDFDEGEILSSSAAPGDPGIISNVGGETIRMLRPEGIPMVENYFDSLPAISEESPQLGETDSRVRVRRGDITLFLYDGYDWASTRKTIEQEIKEMKRRLAKIRQLVSSGQTYDPEVDETSTLLFNSVYVGLEQDLENMEPDALVAAIDEQLKDDDDAVSQSSWQSLRPQGPGKSAPPPTRSSSGGHRLTRARGPSIEFRLMGLDAEVDHFLPEEDIVSRTFATVRDIEILDHVKTSTWKKFLTALRSDSRGNVRETGSNMVRVELRSVKPVPGNLSEEARLRAKILPLRLHVDQDALDFLKKFFSFQGPTPTPAPPPKPPANEIYFQLAEVFPVGLKLDYKPRRVDYRALRDGKTIELMNFFHFDGAEMTLRHITLSGITGWPRFFDLLNDLWTPDVKATQLADVISGVAPIRSVVNVGSGVADLVLLPIAQYRKDGRVFRGVQKGARSFVKSTAMEAVKLGARLATGTQVILEQTENVLGSAFDEQITAETVIGSPVEPGFGQTGQDWPEDRETVDLISKYAEQPGGVTEGVQSAYTSLRRNLNSAAQTILAVPMEVYERSGNGGPVRAVIRAVPIAVLKPMIGASEAVSKTLLGLHNSMDPEVRLENEAKYKQR